MGYVPEASVPLGGLFSLPLRGLWAQAGVPAQSQSYRLPKAAVLAVTTNLDQVLVSAAHSRSHIILDGPSNETAHRATLSVQRALLAGGFGSLHTPGP